MRALADDLIAGPAPAVQEAAHVEHLPRLGGRVAVRREPGEQHHPLHERVVVGGQRPRHHRLSVSSKEGYRKRC
jgi:hypothetical protein